MMTCKSLENEEENQSYKKSELVQLQDTRPLLIAIKDTPYLIKSELRREITKAKASCNIAAIPETDELLVEEDLSASIKPSCNSSIISQNYVIRLA